MYVLLRQKCALYRILFLPKLLLDAVRIFGPEMASADRSLYRMAGQYARQNRTDGEGVPKLGVPPIGDTHVRRVKGLQGYFAHKKTLPPRNLQ